MVLFVADHFLTELTDLILMMNLSNIKPNKNQKRIVSAYTVSIKISEGSIKFSTNQCVSITQNGGLVRNNNKDRLSYPKRLNRHIHIAMTGSQKLSFLYMFKTCLLSWFTFKCYCNYMNTRIAFAL